MTSVFWEYVGTRKAVFIGTQLRYGFYLEMYLQRQFLTRTLNEMLPKIKQVLLPRGGLIQIK